MESMLEAINLSGRDVCIQDHQYRIHLNKDKNLLLKLLKMSTSILKQVITCNNLMVYFEIKIVVHIKKSYAKKEAIDYSPQNFKLPKRDETQIDYISKYLLQTRVTSRIRCPHNCCNTITNMPNKTSQNTQHLFKQVADHRCAA